MSLISHAINTAWMLSCRRETRRFQKATSKVESTQLAVLREILAANSDSAFGRSHGFSTISNYHSFANRVPVSLYENYRQSIERICNGESNVLTSEPVKLLEPTSGTTDGRKLIPYTRSLRTQMQRAVSAWIGDLYWQRPAIRKGTAYWSISPAFGSDEITRGGLKIGFADDTEYLGKLERLGVRQVLAVSPEVSQIQSIAAFQQETLLQLLAAKDLSLISVWSPTFLTTLIDILFATADQLVSDLQTLDRHRAKKVAAILRSPTSQAEKLTRIWPALALISCWSDGVASDYLYDLHRLFPNVEVQPKGILSTESFLSIPLIGREGSALAIRSHFFEFESEGCESEIRLAHELELGERYCPVVTTGGGLYRYKTNDVVEVVGFENQAPMIRFIDRADCVDMVGEKLEESFVRSAIEFTVSQFLGADDLVIGAAMLVPIVGPPAGYCLLVEGGFELDLARVVPKLEMFLCRNPHYNYARQVGQLNEVLVKRIKRKSLWSDFESNCIESGIRLGDIKPMVLCRSTKVAAKMLSKTMCDFK